MKMTSLSTLDASIVTGLFLGSDGCVLRIKRIFFLILSKVGGSFRKDSLSAPYGRANKNMYMLWGLRKSSTVLL